MQTHLVTAQPFPRRDFLDIAEVAILLDVDGTILDVAATPHGVAVPASLVRTLAELHGRTGGALALVSGRLMENLDRLFVPLKLPCVGGHGVEWRIADGAPIQRRHAELNPLLKTQVTAVVTVDPRIIVEDKGSSLAVHYRLAPELGPLIKNKIAAILDRAPGDKLEMLCGKAAIEIKPPNFNKGVARHAESGELGQSSRFTRFLSGPKGNHRRSAREPVTFARVGHRGASPCTGWGSPADRN
jgi:trehalose 6-phosphate phosphatase